MRDKFRPSQTRDSFRAKYLVERLRDSWQHLLRDRATRTLTYNDEQFHALEKIKVFHFLDVSINQRTNAFTSIHRLQAMENV